MAFALALAFGLGSLPCPKLSEARLSCWGTLASATASATAGFLCCFLFPCPKADLRLFSCSGSCEAARGASVSSTFGSSSGARGASSGVSGGASHKASICRDGILAKGPAADPAGALAPTDAAPACGPCVATIVAISAVAVVAIACIGSTGTCGGAALSSTLSPDFRTEICDVVKSKSSLEIFPSQGLSEPYTSA